MALNKTQIAQFNRHLSIFNRHIDVIGALPYLWRSRDATTDDVRSCRHQIDERIDTMRMLSLENAHAVRPSTPDNFNAELVTTLLDKLHTLRKEISSILSSYTESDRVSLERIARTLAACDALEGDQLAVRDYVSNFSREDKLFLGFVGEGVSDAFQITSTSILGDDTLPITDLPRRSKRSSSRKSPAPKVITVRKTNSVVTSASVQIDSYAFAERITLIADGIAALRQNSTGDLVADLRNISSDLQSSAPITEKSKLKQIASRALKAASDFYQAASADTGAQIVVAGVVGGILGFIGTPAVIAYGMTIAAWHGKDAFANAVAHLPYGGGKKKGRASRT